jgi:putative glutamine amidotransferase
MSVRIAIPEPTSLDAEYNGRSIRPYLEAIEAAGAVPAIVPLGEPPARIAQGLASAQGILLPGSRYDVDPQIYGEESIPECAPPDPSRVAADELLLRDAFDLQKPILAICYGVQALNVWRNGALYQDIETQVGKKIDHRPGRHVVRAHAIEIAPGSRLAAMAAGNAQEQPWVNSSHHQAVRRLGDNLVVAAVSPADGVVEAVELDSAEHFVVGVQWHPERTVAESRLSRAIFEAFVAEARTWRPWRLVEPAARR